MQALQALRSWLLQDTAAIAAGKVRSGEHVVDSVLLVSEQLPLASRSRSGRSPERQMLCAVRRLARRWTAVICEPESCQ